MKSVKILSGVALGLAIANPAFALSTPAVFGYYPGPTAVGYASLNWAPSSITLPGFDTGLGTLTSVDITWSGNLGSTHSAQNIGGTTVNVNLSTFATLTLRRPDLSTTLVVTSPNVISAFTLAPGASETKPEAFGSDSDNANINTGLGDFIGATITLGTTGTAFNGSDGGGSISTTFENRAKGQVSIVYNYTNDVPEPKVYGAIGAVACLGLLGYRRYRNSRQA